MVLEVQLLFRVKSQIMACLGMLLVELITDGIELGADRAERFIKVGLDHIVVVR